MTEQPYGNPDALDPELIQNADEYATFADPGQGSADERMAAAEQFLGLAEDIRFEDAVAQKLAAETRSSGDVRSSQAILAARGVTIDAVAAPSSYDLEGLSDQDWEMVKTSKQPLLELHAAANYRREEAATTFVPAGRQFPKHSDPRVGYDGLRNRALIASLPLAHGMSAAAFVRLAEGAGTMQSNKGRYKQGGSDALAFHSEGVGATNLEDRVLGLDQFVFFDYGRPAVNHRKQPEITLVFDQSVLDTAGTFMTAQDIADTSSTSQYMRGLTTPQYFRETALLRIHNTVTEQGETRSGGYHTGYTTYNDLGQWMRGQDGDFNQKGYPLFSTYEIKVPDPPGVSTTALRRVIVRDEATFRHFQETMGDRFEFIYEPRLRAAGERIPDYPGDPRDSAAIDKGNYPELLQIPGAFEQKMGELIEADHKERTRVLDGLPETEREQVVAVFGTSDPTTIDGENVQTRISTKTNLYQYNGTVAIYPSMDDLQRDVTNTTNLREYYTAADQAPWFYNPFRFSGQREIATPSGKCVVATIERSKQNPHISRIVDMRSFGLDEVGAVV